MGAWVANERILILDDEELVRASLAAVLEGCGYSAISAGTPEEALTILGADPLIALIFADVLMAGVDDLTLLDTIVLDYPWLPIVLCTAVDDPKFVTSAFRRGATDYLMKPFTREELLAAASRALEAGRLRRQICDYRENLEEVVGIRTRKLRMAMRELEQSYDITLQAMGDALDLRDAETEGHSRRVTAYTTTIAREMGLGVHQLCVIARGAFLHDIGKIAVPDRVLLKPGRLDPEETEMMRKHCDRGYAMVSKIPFLKEASEIVYAHQESFDGGGYPRGLKGEEIPLGARIFAIADTLDAITSDRPYRKGRTFEEARTEIERWAGRQFDPAIVDVFLRVPTERWSEVRTQVQQMPDGTAPAVLCRPTFAAAGL